LTRKPLHFARIGKKKWRESSRGRCSSGSRGFAETNLRRELAYRQKTSPSSGRWKDIEAREKRLERCGYQDEELEKK